MLIDTHCHLTDKRFLQDYREVIREAREAGIEEILMPTVDLKDAKRARMICEEEDAIYMMAGLYPGKVRERGKIENEIKRLKEFIERDKKHVRGVGEIGLDEYWMKRQGELEQEVFEGQLVMAKELGMPVVIHNRGADRAMKEVLGRADESLRGHFHCWGGDDELLEMVIARGFYVGFCGNVTYPANKKLQEQARRVPAEQLLIETDSPYLPPQGKRGERNTPSNVKITASFLAGIRGVELAELAQQTSENARKLYSL